MPVNEIKKNGTVVFDNSLGDNISEQFSKQELKTIFKKAKLNLDEINEISIGYVCKLSK